MRRSSGRQEVRQWELVVRKYKTENRNLAENGGEQHKNEQNTHVNVNAINNALGSLVTELRPDARTC